MRPKQNEKKNARRNHTLKTPAEDQPGGEKLEKFVRKLAKSVKPAKRGAYTMYNFAKAVRTLGLKVPVSQRQVKDLISSCGIALIEKEPQDLPYPMFIYNKIESRWEIYTFSSRSLGWRRDVMHEFFEIVFWRCFHEIDWWKLLAVRWRCETPHNKADDFAFYLLMTCGEFQKHAVHVRFNLWQLTRHFGVTKNLAFRAMRQYVGLPFPMCHFVLTLDPETREITLADLMMPDMGRAIVWHHESKPAKTKLVQQSRAELDEAETLGWAAVEGLQGRLSDRMGLRFSRDDIVYGGANTGQVWCDQVTCVAGLTTAAPVSVIVRRGPRLGRLVYVQVVPVGEEEAFLPHKFSSDVDDDDWAYDEDWDEPLVGLEIPPLL